jgi:UDPglucose--hexose-1-phosphate uridylyltransferase
VIDCLDDPASGAWGVRVVANKYPALTRAARPDQHELGPVFREMGGYGAHEVVIEPPEHSRPFASQPIEQAERVMRMLHARFVALMADPYLRAVVVFKNHGERAGTSQPHPHWQIIATPVVPRQLRLKHEIATEYFDRTSKCLYCVTLEEELRAGTRVLAASEHYVTVLPFASHVPYQLRILPREHRSSFGSLPVEHLRPLAEMLQNVLARLDAALGPTQPHDRNGAARGRGEALFCVAHRRPAAPRHARGVRARQRDVDQSRAARGGSRRAPARGAEMKLAMPAEEWSREELV